MVERYDTDRGVWSTLDPMPTARWDAAAFVLEGKMYVSGGTVFADEDCTDVVERYDPVSDVWDAVASLLTLPVVRSPPKWTTLTGCCLAARTKAIEGINMPLLIGE